jgi:uncharacterized membrane protein
MSFGFIVGVICGVVIGAKWHAFFGPLITRIVAGVKSLFKKKDAAAKK